jgi:hypothetical protein
MVLLHSQGLACSQGCRPAPGAPSPPYSWGTPVRAHVQAAGFTVSPLLPRYTGALAFALAAFCWLFSCVFLMCVW